MLYSHLPCNSTSFEYQINSANQKKSSFIFSQPRSVRIEILLISVTSIPYTNNQAIQLHLNCILYGPSSSKNGEKSISDHYPMTNGQLWELPNIW